MVVLFALHMTVVVAAAVVVVVVEVFHPFVFVEVAYTFVVVELVNSSLLVVAVAVVFVDFSVVLRIEVFVDRVSKINKFDLDE